MKVFIAIDSSPASQRVLEGVAARTLLCAATAVDVVRFAEWPFARPAISCRRSLSSALSSLGSPEVRGCGKRLSPRYHLRQANRNPEYGRRLRLVLRPCDAQPTHLVLQCRTFQAKTFSRSVDAGNSA